MRPSRPLDPIAAVGALAERTRRRLYEYVAARGAPVGRDEAASALDVGRPLAAFHLDRLVEGGLLETEYRRMTGRSGPGAGRPAKLYRRAASTLEVSLPARRYDVAAALFADAIEAGEAGTRPADALLAAARERGRELGAGARARRGAAEPEAECLHGALAAAGFEPVEDDAGGIRLRNCPFDALAAAHRDLTCGMNLALLEGLTDAATEGYAAVRSVVPGYCCVALERTGQAPQG